jgi:deoxycytidine triphosphate deaminase
MTLLIDSNDLEGRIEALEHQRAVWNDGRFGAWAYLGGITALDGLPIKIGPASIDLRIDGWVQRARWYWRNPLTRRLVWKLMPAHRRNMKAEANEMFYWEPRRTFAEYVLWPNEFVLMSTMEYVKIPDDALGLIKMRSTPARMGLNHALAGLLDPGFGGKTNNDEGCTITLEFKNQGDFPIVMKMGESYVQLVMFDLCGATNNPYNGRYVTQGRAPASPRQEKL